MEIMLIKNTIIELCKNEDVSLRLMAHGMNSKFDKYWGKFDKVNLLLFVAIVIDPVTNSIIFDVVWKKFMKLSMLMI